ncbi:DUF438 domain-containing protein [Thalassotalea sp. PLHSN55]|uniref:DUF438 domain-containing protein n=1 Tax=Thalassotalea sp. PLHSN55 TaxID=3435888 RepID=UPI003F83F327
MRVIPQYAEKLADGHPVKVYFQESELIISILKELLSVEISEDFQQFYNLFNQLADIEKRFARKENQLFPYLEKHGWTGPSKGMWAFHDKIRDTFRSARTAIEQKDYDRVNQLVYLITDDLQGLLHIEEVRLFPNALELLSEQEWQEMGAGDSEIGWMLAHEPAPYPEQDYVHPGEDRRKRRLPFSTQDLIKMDEGYMSTEQLNLMLKFMPVDLTYVDENDHVIFYNRGENRVFPRSAGIIGREVKFCHPPKSVNVVLDIVEAFKAGTQDNAEFWIDFKDRKIHIRYFAIRNEEGDYKGVIEMSQDITDILKIDGQKRLLEWQ